MNSDPILGVHGKALQLREQRTVVLSSNLANASTPNYKARDFDFNSALQRATGSEQLSGKKAVFMEASNPNHMAAQDGLTSLEMKYRVPHFPAVDGNTVDSDLEKSAFADNALRYQSSLTFLKNRVAGILTMIKGS